MSTSQQDRTQLEALRATLVQPYQEAKSRGDTAAMAKLSSFAGEIDDLLDNLALIDFQDLATKMAAIKTKINAASQKAKSWPFGFLDAPVEHERSFRGNVSDNDYDDSGPTADPPQPAPVLPNAIPTVSPGWSENYLHLWGTISIRPEWQKIATEIAKKIIHSQGRYAAVVSGTSIPWWFIAVVHSMECSLRFDQHLHNGDPLTGRTVIVPKGRPPFGAPPFDWETSARDSIVYEKLDKVTDWSLASVLFHWHRYNGINNEYKKRGIPTPYLWSGSQHYSKGKYVADHVFDANAVSGQVGAAVILKALAELRAVMIDTQLDVQSNPAAAIENIPVLSIDRTGAAFKHIATELGYPGGLNATSPKNVSTEKSTTRVQEWLNIHGLATPIDGDFGHSTTDQLKAFQKKKGRDPTGVLDAETWSLLTAPMRHALAPVDNASQLTFEDLVVRVAQQHIAQLPVEIGGNNCGPWVRLYMQGKEGTSQKWCSGFVCLIVAQAAKDLGVNLPFNRRVGVDELVADAKSSDRFIKEADVSDTVRRKSKLRPGQIFVVRASVSDWTHTGIILSINSDTFDTLEGNTGGDGGTDGANARQGNRSYANKDFVRLI